MIVTALDLAGTAPGPAVTKVFASQHGRSIDEVLAAVAAAVGDELDVRTGEDPSASSQGRDLRFRSVVLPEVDARAHVPFDEGVRRTVDDVRAAHDADGAPAAPAPPRRGDLPR